MTEEKIEEILDSLVEKYQEAVTNARPSYSVGEYKVSYSEYLAHLQKQIEFFQNQLTQLPSEEVTLWR